MKIPKSVVIAGKTYKVSNDKDFAGAHFATAEQTIKLGTGYNEEIRTIFFLHEVIEAIMTERQLRYSVYEDSGHLFVMNHDQYQNLVNDIYFALKDNLV